MNRCMDAIEILYEDNHIISINKRNSDIVQADKTGDIPLAQKVKDFIKKRDKKPGNVFLGITHRLDRPTSGVVLFAKTGKALTRLNAMFSRNLISKTYWAVIDKKPPEKTGMLVNYLKRNRNKNKSYTCTAKILNSKKAVLEYRLTGKSKEYYFLEMKMLTGRHHQIRAQLAEIGCCIKGDLKYGAKRSNPGGGIHLHAREISFIHPVSKKRITITAPVPKDVLWNEFLKTYSISVII